MQGTSNAAVDKTAEKTGTEKVHEKLAERRRALGRGLESLLPGPRVVTAPTAPTLPQSARNGTVDAVLSSGSQFSDPRVSPRLAARSTGCGAWDFGRVAGGGVGTDCGWGDGVSVSD